MPPARATVIRDAVLRDCDRFILTADKVLIVIDEIPSSGLVYRELQTIKALAQHIKYDTRKGVSESRLSTAQVQESLGRFSRNDWESAEAALLALENCRIQLVAHISQMQDDKEAYTRVEKRVLEDRGDTPPVTEESVRDAINKRLGRKAV